jgi:hypothetical protein
MLQDFQSIFKLFLLVIISYSTLCCQKQSANVCITIQIFMSKSSDLDLNQFRQDLDTDPDSDPGKKPDPINKSGT